jgi:cytochrome c peroxidase
MPPIRQEPSYVDNGVGNFLASGHLLSQPSSVDARWLGLAPDNQGRFQVPTLRNVDKRPYPNFVKAYGHNGYFTSLKSIVHFYNTRDVLPRCRPNDPGEGTTCWPTPESTANMNTKRMGRLGLSNHPGGCAGKFHANADRRLHASRSAVKCQQVRWVYLHS